MRIAFYILWLFFYISSSKPGDADLYIKIDDEVNTQGKTLSINISTAYKDEKKIFNVRNIHFPDIPFSEIRNKVLYIPLKDLSFKNSPAFTCEMVIKDEKTGYSLSRPFFKQKKRNPYFSEIRLFLRSLTLLEGEVILIDR